MRRPSPQIQKQREQRAMDIGGRTATDWRNLTLADTELLPRRLAARGRTYNAGRQNNLAGSHTYVRSWDGGSSPPPGARRI